MASNDDHTVPLAPIEVPYAVLAATAPDAIITIDAESRILSVNPATERIFGWSAQEMLGQPLTILMPADHTERHRVGMHRYLTTGARHIPWTGVTLPGLRRDGRQFPMEVSFGEFLHNGQRVFSGFLRDISDRVAQQAALKRSAADLERALATLAERVSDAEEARRTADSANQAKSQFLAVMSHELRTPLNAIGGYVELLESEVRGPITSLQREDLVRIGRAQARLLGLVTDVLEFARIEQGRLEFDLRDIPVNPLLSTLGPLVERQLSAKSLTYHCDPGPPEMHIWADQQKLEQILLNMLSNAVKFTPAGGRIDVWTDASAEAVRMHVRDTGVGIPADRLSAVFEPFVQVDSTLTRVHGGTGLGLAISQELAQGMGGLITVESTVGQGTTFTIALPTADACRTHGPPLAGDLLARDAMLIVRRTIARLHAEPALPSASDAELADHLASLLTDLAQLLVILDTGGGRDATLVRDGARIQEVIIDLHGRQRARLGWTPAQLAREFDVLADEAAAALRAHAHDGQLRDADECVSLVRALLEEAKAVGLRSLAATR